MTVSEAERMINAGIEIELKKLGKKVKVRELTMEQIIQGTSNLAVLLVAVDFSQKVDPATMLQTVLKQSEVMDAFRYFAAASTETKEEDWEGAPVGDWVKLIKAVKKVVDWGEMKELFTELGLGERFQARKPLEESQDEPQTKTKRNESKIPQPD